MCLWACVEVWGTSFEWTHSCFDIDGPGRGEEDQLPQRTVGGGGVGAGEGVNCQRLLSALMQGLERVEGAVRPS